MILGTKSSQKRIRFIVAFIAVFSVFHAVAQDNEQNAYLSQDELKQISQLLERRQNASNEDIQVAQSFLKIADQAVNRNNWGAAFKGYAESATIRPSVDALAGMSVSISRIPRERKNCADAQIAKLRDFSEAFMYLSLALELSKTTKERLNLRHFHKEVTDAQQISIEQYAKCIDK